MNFLLKASISITHNVMQLNEVADLYLDTFIRSTMNKLNDKISNESQSQPSYLGAVICSSREKNPNFKKEIFEKKIAQHIKCGYTREFAEWKVLGDFNRLFFKFIGVKPNKRLTDVEGYYI